MSVESVGQVNRGTPLPGSRRSRVLRRAGALVLAALCLVVIGVWCLRWVPLPPGLGRRPAGSWEFVDRHGHSLRAVPEGPGYSRWVSLESIPSSYVAATLAAEDKRFWRHPGVDGLATARALMHRLRYGRIVSGGSTITQQLIKMAAPRPRTWRTKLIEALQALRLEQVWTKPRILEEYLNRLDYGNQCFGCAEAAVFYFSKPLADVSAAEAALLAGLPQAPSRLNPVRHPERARKRQQWILDRMRQTGVLDVDAWKRARAEALRYAAPRRRFEAPHLIDRLMLSSMAPGADEGGDAGGGGVVRTTVDLEVQRLAERALRRHLDPLRERSVRNGAIVVIENATGDVLALVGSPDFFAVPAGQVNGAWARRSPGSALKPFTVLLALERGVTPATVVADLPVDFPTATGVFRPVNYDRRHHGPVRVRVALANSLNIPAVKLLDQAGGPALLRDRLRAWGLTTLMQAPEHYGLGLTLGNAEVRLLELTSAYAALARLGEYRPYRLLRGVDAVAPEDPPGAGFDPRPAWLVADILSDNGARVLAFGAESDLRFEFPVACKTGTSSGFRDNWAFGYTPEYTVGVWVGNAEGSPMDRVSGVTGAAPVLQEIFRFLHRRWGTSWYPTPPGIVQHAVHPLTGHRLDPSDPRGVREKFLADCLPPVESPADYDAQGRVRLPALYRAWLESAENGLGTAAAADPDLAGALIRIRVPMAGSVFYLDADLPADRQWLGLDAEGPSGLTWESPTLAVRTDADRPRVRLEEGRHQLRVRAADGSADAETWILVKRR